MKSIVIIIPYYGPFPKQFKFWVQSALNNPTIDFLIFTNNQLGSNANIKVINTTFAEFKAIVQSKFDFTIALNSPYKICDYKGAYGYIFSDYLKSYDFWGFGDVDLVYGDIRYFLTDEILSIYKVFLGFGHLTLYKNDKICNLFFKTKIDGYQYYRDVFTNKKNSVFDEFLHGGLSDMWQFKHPQLIWDNKPFDDILVPRESFNFKSVFNPPVSNHLIFEYSEKNLSRIYLDPLNQIIKEPTLYAHFQQRKFMKVRTNNTDKYLIIPNAYINYVQVTIPKLNKWCKPNDFHRLCWNFKNRVIKRLRMLIFFSS
jgi:hypothetical protein